MVWSVGPNSHRHRCASLNFIFGGFNGASRLVTVLGYGLRVSYHRNRSSYWFDVHSSGQRYGCELSTVQAHILHILSLLVLVGRPSPNDESYFRASNHPFPTILPHYIIYSLSGAYTFWPKLASLLNFTSVSFLLSFPFYLIFVTLGSRLSPPS